jgi:hypothetical protein
LLRSSGLFVLFVQRIPMKRSICDSVRWVCEEHRDQPGAVRVVAFNTAERRSQEVSEEIADELGRCIDLEGRETPRALEGFLDRHGGGRPVQLPLPLRGA